IITSVAINACTRPFATITPVTAPIAAPNASAAATATSALTSIPTIDAATAPVSASREPTDKSIPEVKITSVIPTAIMAFTEVCWSMLKRLLTVKKLGLMVDTTAISTNSAISDFCSNSHALVKYRRPETAWVVIFLLLIHAIKLAHSGSHQNFLGGLLASEFTAEMPFMHDDNAIAHA